MLGGAVALVTLISGGVGFFLFLMVKFMAKKQAPDVVEESDNESEEDEKTENEQDETQE
jgi:hypothetical protein